MSWKKQFAKLASEFGEAAVARVSKTLAADAPVAEARAAARAAVAAKPSLAVKPKPAAPKAKPAAPKAKPAAPKKVEQGTERFAAKTDAKAAKAAKPLAVNPKPRAKPAAPVRPPNPLQVISQEFSPSVARRLDGMIDADAPLSEWRAAAARLKDADLAVNNTQRAPSPYSVKPAQVATDPRIESRKGELGKIADLELHIAPRVTDPQPQVSVFDKEGHGYIMSMSDLSAAGDDLIGINDVMFRQPFSRKGGQGYMFDNPGEVWAADKKAAEEHVELADQLQRETGKPTLLFPWTMGPLSIDFSHQPRGAQYMYADAAMGAADRNKLAADIKTILPDWRGFEDPEGVQMFMGAAGKSRKALNKLLDRYRDRGGLGIGAARYATTDLSQIGTPLTTLRNVGVIDPRFGAAPSSHSSYSYGVPGQGEGVLAEPNIGALALAPDIMAALGYKTPFDFPVGVQSGAKSPMRSMQLKPKGGVLDYKTLRHLDDMIKGNAE